jgi:tetratricopeptide (TPR) repeat protein
MNQEIEEKLADRKFEEASDLLIEDLKLGTDDQARAEIYALLAAVHLCMQNFDDAELYYNLAIQTDPTNIKYVNSLARYYLSYRNNAARAIEVLKSMEDVAVANDRPEFRHEYYVLLGGLQCIVGDVEHGYPILLHAYGKEFSDSVKVADLSLLVVLKRKSALLNLDDWLRLRQLVSDFSTWDKVQFEELWA